MDYLLHLATLVSIYVVLAISLDLLAGHTGLLSLAHAAFSGIGGYASALLIARTGMDFLSATATAMAIAAVTSVSVSLASHRLRDDYLVVATLGFQLVFTGIVVNATELTRGPLGLAGIPRPRLGDIEVAAAGPFALLASVWALILWTSTVLTLRSRVGRLLHAIREDEIFVASIGRNVLWSKVIVFAVSAAMAASAGSLYAQYMSYIDPGSFALGESLLIVSMVLLGGPGTAFGAVVGAALLVAIPEVLRFLALPNASASAIRQLLYGATLIVVLRWRSSAGARSILLSQGP
jgi:branched-chain amino acid transport system permease protein